MKKSQCDNKVAKGLLSISLCGFFIMEIFCVMERDYSKFLSVIIANTKLIFLIFKNINNNSFTVKRKYLPNI